MTARPVRIVRILAAAASAAVVLVSLLGWSGAIPVGTPGPEPADALEAVGRPLASAPAGTTRAPRATPTARPSPRPAGAVTGRRPDRTRLPAGSGSGRRVVFDISVQRVWLVGADGRVNRTYRVSGSRFDQLDAGSYRVWSTSRRTTSWKGDERMEYMVRFAHGERAAIGFHSIPVTPRGEPVQTKAQLGVPLSDGCIRQLLADARALWDFAPVGTRVVVVRSA